MANGKNESEWNQTASIMALTANINRDPKKGNVYTVSDFHPMISKQKAIGDIKILKEAFIKRRGKK